MNQTLLDRMVGPLAECLTPEAARKIADLRAEDDAQARMEALGDKANQGALTAEEQAEYDRYLAAYHLVTILQARARRLLSA